MVAGVHPTQLNFLQKLTFMSFILHIIDCPTATTVNAASHHVYDEEITSTVQNEKFLRFAKLVSKLYPECEDDEGDNDDNIWSEGLPDGIGTEAVLTIAVKTDLVESQIMSNIAHAAVDAGLQILDPQNAMLWRSDRLIVYQNQQTEAFLPQKLPKRSKRKRVPKLTKEGTRDYLLENFVKAFVQDGWQTVSDERNVYFKRSAWRQLGDIKQTLTFNTNIDGQACDIGMDFKFTAEQIRIALDELLPDTGLDIIRRNIGSQYYDIHLPIEYLFPLAELKPLGIKDIRLGWVSVSSQQELEQWAAHFQQWYQQFLSKILSQTQDISSLCHLLDTELHRNYSQGRLTNAEPWLPRLILYHLANSPKLENWLALSRERFNSELKFLEFYSNQRSGKTGMENLDYSQKLKFDSWKQFEKLADTIESLHKS